MSRSQHSPGTVRSRIGAPPPPVRRLIMAASSMLAGLLLTSTVALVPSAAHADTAPPVPGTPETVSSDPLPAPQIDGVVWDQVVIGNVVYVGGDFTTARPAGSPPGQGTVARANFLAYNLTTGALVTTFAPSFNAPVRALAASPDGSRLYVGGRFTAVNGATRYRLAAFAVGDGSLVASFRPTLNSSVQALAATNTTVFLGGTFSSVQGAARSKVAALAASTAQLLLFATTVAGGDVAALALSPSATELVLGGNFTSVNGSSNPGYGLASVDTTMGSLRPFAVNAVVRNGGSSAGITSLAADATGVYGSGYVYGGGGNLEGGFKAGWGGGAIIWMEDCHGDTYSIAPGGSTVYAAGHAHSCRNISTGGFPDYSLPSGYYRALGFTTAATGRLTTNTAASYANFAGQPAPSLQHWFPDIGVGRYTGLSQGPWDVTTAGGYVLYGGEFTTVNGTAQQGLVRFATKTLAPNKDGPRLSGATMKSTIVAAGSGTARLSWTANYDRDNSDLRYEVIRDGNTANPVATVRATSNFWTRPQLTVTNTGLTAGRSYGYRIRTIDPFGNATMGDTVTFTPASGARVAGSPPSSPSSIPPPNPATPPDGTATNAAPAAIIAAQVDGLTAALSAAGSTDADGTIVSEAWLFGDGSAATGSTARHTYASPGHYTVTLTVTDDAGATATATTTLTVAAPG